VSWRCFGAVTPLETASLQKANGRLQASPAEVFERDASMEGVTYALYLCIFFQVSKCFC